MVSTREVADYDSSGVISLPYPDFVRNEEGGGEREWSLRFANSHTAETGAAIARVLKQSAEPAVRFETREVAGDRLRFVVVSPVEHPGSDPVMFATRGALTALATLSNALLEIESVDVALWRQQGVLGR